MLRTALKPRLLALLALLIVVVIAFIRLGIWQWDVAHSKGHKSAIEKIENQAPIALNDYIRPQDTFPANGSLRKVTLSGRYDGAHQVLVAGRVLNGVNGWWVVTPVVVDGTGARIPVVRGFVSKTSGVPTSDARVEVAGALAPGESPSTGTYPAGQTGTVDLSWLLDKWGGNIYNAFVFETNEQPSITAAPIQRFAPPQPVVGGLQLLNAGYAIQWWVFTLFAIVIYTRQVRDEHELDQAAGRTVRSDAHNDLNEPSIKDQHV